MDANPSALYTKTELPKSEWDSVITLSTLHPGFQIENIYSINQTDITKNIWFEKLDEITKATHNLPSHTMQLWHTPNDTYIEQILSTGLDIAFANRGFYGKALYFSDNPIKANDYSKYKCNPESIRIMLKCTVITGNTKTYELGHFDRDLNTAPIGYNSVCGFIRRATEYAVYNNAQVLITHMITYKFTDTVYETKPSSELPANINPQNLCYLNPNMSEFISNIIRKTNIDRKHLMKKNVHLLLYQAITPEKFLSNAELILGVKPTANVLENIHINIAKCKLITPDARQLVIINTYLYDLNILDLLKQQEQKAFINSNVVDDKANDKEENTLKRSRT